MLSPIRKANRFRIALLGIYHESNSFVEEKTTLQHFKQGRWLKGKMIIDGYRDAHHELGGAIEVFLDQNAELVPVFYAETTPGGIITEEAYKALVDEMMKELNKVVPVDACFVVPHGAAVSEYQRDMDGSWLELLRKKVGNEIPIVGTLDPHANVSPKMINATQGLFPYSTNPHVDQRETGKIAARFLLDVLNKKINPVQQLLQAPIAISIEQQETAVEPCKSLYEYAHDLCETEYILHINIALGFPYADVNEMGTSMIIITDNDVESAEAVKQLLASYLVDHKQSFVGEKFAIKALISKIKKSPKPVLLLDMGDNVGGGGNGNSTYLLEELDTTDLKSFYCIYDPKAVGKCIIHSQGETFSLDFGLHPETGNAYTSLVTLVSIHTGIFSEAKPMHGGQMNYDMGRTAIVVTAEGNTIMLHSKRVPPFSLAQLTSCNIDASLFDVIVAKGVVAPLAAYKSVCANFIRVNTPGVTQADMTKFKFQNRRKPLYPFE